MTPKPDLETEPRQSVSFSLTDEDLAILNRLVLAKGSSDKLTNRSRVVSELIRVAGKKLRR